MTHCRCNCPVTSLLYWNEICMMIQVLLPALVLRVGGIHKTSCQKGKENCADILLVFWSCKSDGLKKKRKVIEDNDKFSRQVRYCWVVRRDKINKTNLQNTNCHLFGAVTQFLKNINCIVTFPQSLGSSLNRGSTVMTNFTCWFSF